MIKDIKIVRLLNVQGHAKIRAVSLLLSSQQLFVNCFILSILERFVFNLLYMFQKRKNIKKVVGNDSKVNNLATEPLINSK